MQVDIISCLNASRLMFDRFGMVRLFHWGIVLGKNEYKQVFTEDHI